MHDNPNLKTLNLPAITDKDYTIPENKCTTKVEHCGKTTENGMSCHRFYKCINGVAYSCQNPKRFFSTCSGKYYLKYFFGKTKYRCGTAAEARDMCH